MKKKSFAVMLLFLSAIFLTLPLQAHAKTSIVYRRRTIATVKDGVMTYIPKSGDNANDLEYLLNNDKKKELIIPKKSTVYIGQVVDIGSNTTIQATGATIIQTDASKGLIKHEVDADNYNSIQNVTIIGGTWKNQSNTKGHTFIRFAHGKKLNFKKMTILSNYQSHALELIACKDVKVIDCTMKAEDHGTKKKNSVEDAIQIDIATPKTAPGVLKETKQTKYVNGQTCRNVRIEKCKITGARGVCANFPSSEEKYWECYHRDITIVNCDIMGTSSQGIALYNTINSNVQGNTVRTTSKRENTAYPSAINLYLYGKKAGGTNKIVNNKIYGMKRGIYINSMRKGYYGKTTITGNKLYIKKGIKGAMPLEARYCRSIVEKNNKRGQW